MNTCKLMVAISGMAWVLTFGTSAFGLVPLWLPSGQYLGHTTTSKYSHINTLLALYVTQYMMASAFNTEGIFDCPRNLR